MRSFGKIFPLVIGIAVVFFGLSMIFDISFPFFRILIGCLVIYLGVVVMTRKYRGRGSSSFNEENINIADKNFEKEYSLVFGKANYDLTDISVTQGNTRIKFSIAFGAGVIKINKKAAVKVMVNTAFGSAKTPDGTVIAFGRHEYTTASFNADKKYLLIDVDLAFGSVEIE